MKLYGLITVDVEPDNVWSDTYSNKLDNIKQLLPFHRLCQEYGVKPTYLITWSVAENKESAKIIEKLLQLGSCEVGVHPHLWETPPFIKLDRTGVATVGPQYSPDIITAKLSSLIDIVKDRFVVPISHRSGRWGIDSRQVKILTRLGIQIDSSLIPGVDWSSTGILDHSKISSAPYWAAENNIFSRGNSQLFEVPCTIKPGRCLWGLEKRRYGATIFKRLGLLNKWLRAAPSLKPQDLFDICLWATEKGFPCNMMTHSSELMAGGSPYWRTSKDIENHLEIYRNVFKWWNCHKIMPVTLSEFYQVYLSEFNLRISCK